MYGAAPGIDDGDVMENAHRTITLLVRFFSAVAQVMADGTDPTSDEGKRESRLFYSNRPLLNVQPVLHTARHRMGI